MLRFEMRRNLNLAICCRARIELHHVIGKNFIRFPGMNNIDLRKNQRNSPKCVDTQLHRGGNDFDISL
jgi:hypothetical protein